MPTLDIPARDALQATLLESPARYKLARWGRRVGKSRAMLLAGVTGHGASEGEASPPWRGIAQGMDVVWLALDYTQDHIWSEEIRPRFSGIAHLNHTERYCSLPGGGTLYLRSSQNVDSIRGLGARLGGALLDECSHYDLEYAWTKVIRPPLADNNGWAIFGSTTKSGWDGNALRQTPSYFNRLCLEQREGKLGPEWEQFEATTREGYHLDPEEIAQLYRDLGAAALEELDAALLTGGPGVWATEWRADLHTLPKVPEIPKWWTWYAGYDWGYYDGWFGVAAVGDGHVVVVEELHHQREHAELAGRHCGELAARYPLHSVGADGSMWAQTAAKKGVGPTIGEEWTRGFTEGWESVMARRSTKYDLPLIVPTAHGAHARNTRSELLHRYLAWEEHRGVPSTPALRFVQVGCPYAIQTISTVPVDPLHPNQPDTHAEDHAWDGIGYLLQVRPQGEEPPRVGRPQDVHPGLEERYHRRLVTMGVIEEKDPIKRSRYREKEMRRL